MVSFQKHKVYGASLKIQNVYAREYMLQPHFRSSIYTMNTPENSLRQPWTEWPYKHGVCKHLSTIYWKVLKFKPNNQTF